MKILIIGRKLDAHVDAILWGLDQFGHNAALFDITKFPCRDKISLHIDVDGNTNAELILDNKLFSAPFDVIWHRRKPQPTPMRSSHPSDIKIITKE